MSHVTGEKFWYHLSNEVIMNKFTKISIFIFTLVGLGLTVHLCKIYYDANFNPYALASFCSVSDFVDCDGVAKTTYSQFLGIPLCLWGMFFYLFVLALLFAEKLAKFKLFRFMEVFKNPQSYIFCLSLLAFCISVCLAGISLFDIHKICVLCIATYLVDLALAIIAKDFSKSLIFEIKQSFLDFIDAIKIKKYLIAFVAVIVVFSGILTYTTMSNILTPQIKNMKIKFSGEKSYPTDQNMMGDANAKVTIHEYFDYNCASCYMLGISLERIMSELDDVRIVQHNMPLDSACNPLLKSGGHQGSCQMARYALAAKKQGKFREVHEIFFDKTPSSEDEIIQLLKQDKTIDIKKLKEDANSPEIKAELRQEIDEAIKKEIEATPTVIINMEKITGNIPYYTMKEKLLKLGATEK